MYLLPSLVLVLSVASVSDARRRSSRSHKAIRGDACISPDPANTVTERLQQVLTSGGQGTILRLCESAQYVLQAPINFTAPDQEISTEGDPIPSPDGSEDKRATLVVFGPVFNGTGHTTAIQGTCDQCSGIRIRHLRINGTRGDAPPTSGGGNIEIGGPNASGQLVEYVKSFDPRSWTCLHVFEGGLKCTNVTIRYNDIGPCGTDNFQQWADGISMACRSSHVHGNWLRNPTDGGVVLFGAPGTVVENNTIWVEKNILIGGINMVDYDPFQADYTDTIVRDNTIIGGFATSPESGGESKGDNNETAIIKIGIAIGPRTWFGDRYGTNQSHGGIVENNTLTGAFGYAMGINSATNFTILNNTLVGNYTFVGSRGPNCTTDDSTPDVEPFVVDQNRVTQSNIQAGVAPVPDADSLTCIVPSNGNYWPFGGDPRPRLPGADDDGTDDTGKRIAIGIAVPVAVIFAALLAYLVRRWFLGHKAKAQGKPTISKPKPSRWHTNLNSAYFKTG